MTLTETSDIAYTHTVGNNFSTSSISNETSTLPTLEQLNIVQHHTLVLTMNDTWMDEQLYYRQQSLRSFTLSLTYDVSNLLFTFLYKVRSSLLFIRLSTENLLVYQPLSRLSIIPDQVGGPLLSVAIISSLSVIWFIRQLCNYLRLSPYKFQVNLQPATHIIL